MPCDHDDSRGVALLAVRGVSKSFQSGRSRRQVLFDVSVDVHAGECLAVIGGSGSGKSTLTRIMLGLERADAGSVAYDGHAVTGRDRTVQRESGLVFQDPFGSLDPRWTVAQSVAEPLRLRGVGRDEAFRRARHALQTVGLDADAFGRRYPVDLSGGQAQRVAIARAIVAEPRVLLADEPMSAIDVAARLQILDAFAAIRAARPDVALVVVSHDLGVVRHLADRILVLHDGSVEEVGPTAEVLCDPQSEYTRELITAATL